MPYPHARHLNFMQQQHICPDCQQDLEAADAALPEEPFRPLTRYALASQLRQRLICGGHLRREDWGLAAAHVIQLFVTCLDCGQPFVTEEQIKAALAEATCAEHWLLLIAELKAGNEEAKRIPGHSGEQGH